jgi:ubiquinone/menaquinone biosynthesis C-methylase UbiE
VIFNPLRRGGDPYLLVVGMTGVKLGERVAQIGCAHGGRLAAVAKRVGLSGRAAVIVPDEASAARARKGAERAGVLLEIEVAPPTRIPLEDASFDLVIVDDTAGFFGSMAPDQRAASVREASRILRPGGRLMVISASQRAGIRRLLGGAPAGQPFDPAPSLQADGFRSVRNLADREGLVFVEGIKPRAAGGIGKAV